MKGSLRVALLLFTALPVQRWLLAGGAVMVAAVYLLLPQEARVLALVGLVLGLFPTLLASGVLLRYIAAPRVMQLIPHVRLQILGAMLLVPVIFATSFAALFLSVWPAGDLLLIWLRVITAVSLLLISQFMLFGTAAGASLVVRPGHRRNCRSELDGLGRFLSLDRPKPGDALRTTCGVVVRLRDLAPAPTPARRAPGQQHGRPGHTNRARQPAQCRARIPVWQSFITRAVRRGIAGRGVHHFDVWPDCQHERESALLRRSVHPGHLVGDGRRRLRRHRRLAGGAAFEVLWLRCGLDRRELFRLCEREAWSSFVATSSGTFLLLPIMWLKDASNGLEFTALLAFQLCSGACLLYLGLTWVRGWRAVDVLMGLALFVAWGVASVCTPYLAEHLPIALTLSAAMLVTAFALRLLGLYRWRRIDWLVCKPPPPLARNELNPV